MNRREQDAMYEQAIVEQGTMIRRLVYGYEAGPEQRRDLFQEFISSFGEVWSCSTAAAPFGRGSTASRTTSLRRGRRTGLLLFTGLAGVAAYNAIFVHPIWSRLSLAW